MRVLLILQTLAVFSAPVTAGLLLTSAGGRALHSASAYTVFTAAVIGLVAAILVWRKGGGSPAPVGYAAVFLVLTLAQIALGIADMKTLHFPLGVLLFGVSILQLTALRQRELAPAR